MERGCRSRGTSARLHHELIVRREQEILCNAKLRGIWRLQKGGVNNC